MEKPDVPLLVILDSGLTYGLQKLLLFVIAFILPILGVIGIVATYKSCFEHGRGLLELSRFEIIAFLLFIALERRFSYYGGLFGDTFWQGLIRLLRVLGIASLVVGVGALIHGRSTLQIDPILLQPIWLSTYLVALYLGAPAAFFEYSAVKKAPADAIEPTLNTADMESKS